MPRIALFLVLCMMMMPAAQATDGTAPAEQGAASRLQEQFVPIGSRIPRWRDLAPQLEAVEVLHRFGRCVATKKTKEARALLSAVPYSPEQRRWVPAIIGRHGSSCLEASKMRLTQPLFVGTVAEGLYQSDPTLQNRALLPKAPPLSFDSLIAPIIGDRDAISEIDKALYVARWLAYCAAHEGPGQIRTFLATKAGSSSEVSALDNMHGLFSKCLLEGQTLKVDRLTIRALLAEAIYLRTASEGAA